MKSEVKFKKVVDNKTQAFVENICNGFKKELEEACIEIGEDLLQYRERTMSSILFPVLEKNSTKTLMEVGFLKDDKRRSLDFYSLDKNNERCYFIEFKHCFDKSSVKHLAKYNLQKWEKVNEQIKDLNVDTSGYIDGNKDMFGISIFMIVVQTDFKELEKENNNDRYSKLYNKINEQFLEADWYWIYETPEKLIKLPKDKKNLFYSNVAFIGIINEVK